MMVTVFGHVGSIVLEMICDKAAVGFYTAAITCAGMSGFVFNAFIDSARPIILSYRQSDMVRFQKSVEGLYSVVFYVAVLQSIVICIAAPLVVNILYGIEYQSAVQPLQVIIWYTVFSYLGPVRNIWILAEEKQRYLWIINLSGAIFSILTNVLLVPYWGVVGAAIAALVTQVFTNVIMGWIIKPLRENNKLMCKGLNPRNIYEVLILLKKSTDAK
jgi:O-antigen/teichoic acid export membrane protein